MDINDHNTTENLEENTNTHIEAPKARNEYSLNDQVAEIFASEIISRCEALPINDSISFTSGTPITDKAVGIIDKHFDINQAGEPMAKDPYIEIFRGGKDIQKRRHKILKTIYYRKFL
ncbi:MAG: hypothetical protein BWY19_00018 [bacterium ADurb.Bin212]|nr:MAG: hypothetical protein BWY19_00018 [bacterium ADurb.Bin212]